MPVSVFEFQVETQAFNMTNVTVFREKIKILCLVMSSVIDSNVASQQEGAWFKARLGPFFCGVCMLE